MTTEELKDIVLCGETSKAQFKQEFTSQKEIAKDMVAFANSRGGQILFGIVDKSGEMVGLSYDEIQSISRELGNTANEQVRPTIYIDTEVVRAEDKRFLVCTVEPGKNKPYKTLTGEIWVKQGADKRRITENAEILSLFQESGSYQTDLSPVNGTSIQDTNRYDLNQYMKRIHGNTIEGYGDRAERILKNVHIIHENGNLTLAGYLFFAENPEYNCPTCMVKAVSFFGNSLGGSSYRDSKEIKGRMPHVYEQCMSFLRSNLHSIQEKGASFNTLGKLEISESILEEVCQNAIIHRDLLRPAPIRILIFDNRVEIVSPGELAGGMTVEDIRNGKTYQRNPQLALFATNTMRFHGLGSGITRILQEQTDIVLENDTSGKEFKVIIPRGRVIKNESKVSEKGTENLGQGTENPQEMIENESKVSEKGTENSGQGTENSEYGTENSGQGTEKLKAILQRASVNGDCLSEKQVGIIKIMLENSRVSRPQLAALLNITMKSVVLGIESMRGKYIKRVGPDKGGHWEVI